MGEKQGLLIITSPPYVNALGKEHTYADHAKREKDSHRRIMTEKGIADPYYGTDPAQLGNMPEGSVHAVVSSPPYEGSAVGVCEGNMGGGPGGRKASALTTVSGNIKEVGYGESPGQLGTTQGDTFWAAARTILEQCTALLPVGGHAMFVVKAYVQGGELVDFPGQWAALCQAAGLTWVHHHRALLTQEHGTELGLFGGETVRTVKRVSFFRRLHEAKRPDLAIECEDVLCFRKDQP